MPSKSSNPPTPKKVKPEPQVVILKKGKFDMIKSLVITAFFILLMIMISFDGDVPGPWEADIQYYDALIQDIDPYSVPSSAELIGFIDLQGIILSKAIANSPIGTNEAVITPNTVRWQIAQLQKAENLKAILIRFSSPGGMVSASDELAYMIKQLNADIPVYVYSPDLLASGGYYASVHASKIFTHRQAEVGSIGVIYELPNVQELTEDKLGIDMEIYKSGKYKDMNSPFRDRTESEKALIQEDIDKAHDTFIAEVQMGRSLEINDVKKIATGQVWSGEDAVQLKMIDGTAYQEEVLSLIQKEREIPDPVYLVEYTKPLTFFEELDMALGSAAYNFQGPLQNMQDHYLKRPAGLYYQYIQ